MMFNRVIMVMNLTLAPVPLALLKDEMLGKPGKPSLRKVIMPEKNLIQRTTSSS